MVRIFLYYPVSEFFELLQPCLTTLCPHVHVFFREKCFKQQYGRSETIKEKSEWRSKEAAKKKHHTGDSPETILKLSHKQKRKEEKTYALTKRTTI